MGIVLKYGTILLHGRSKKQSVVACNSTEAEFKAISKGVCELLWLKRLIIDPSIFYFGLMKLVTTNLPSVQLIT